MTALTLVVLVYKIRGRSMGAFCTIPQIKAENEDCEIKSKHKSKGDGWWDELCDKMSTAVVYSISAA